MKLQISFDMTDLDKAIAIAHKVTDYADQFEIGTMLLFAHGLHAIKTFKETFPHKILLADTRLLDEHAIIPELAQAGADWISILAGASQEAIHSLCKEATKHNLKVLLDLVDASSRAQSALDAKNLGASALLFHQAYNQETSLLFLDNWEMVKDNASLPMFITARINRENFDRIVSLKPHGVVIGRSIVEAADPAAEAAYYYGVLSKD